MSSEKKYRKILTVPDEISTNEKLYLSGNEYVSLPQITPTGGIVSMNVLHLNHKGLLEFEGCEKEPLLEPLLNVDEDPLALSDKLQWDYAFDWMPSFSMKDDKGLTLEGEIVAPPGFKGFYYYLKLKNESDTEKSVKIGWQGCWKSLNFVVFNRREIDGKKSITFNNWTGSLVLEASSGLPLAAAALAVEPDAEWHYDEMSGKYCAFKEIKLKAKNTFELKLFASLNLEADGAATTNVDLRRQGVKALKEYAETWLENRRIKQDSSPLASLLNRNLFFNYFFALGRSLDSEKLVPVTSRSPRYYVSAAFWARDTLLWSYPAVMMVDQHTGRELLLTVFKRYITNAADHALYINGNSLYPGFELDQLAAYFLALKHYTDTSTDHSLLEDQTVLSGLETLVEKALEQFDPNTGLYSTFLDPSDDPVTYPYLTYNNALLQRAFSYLAHLQAEMLWQHKNDFAILAAELQQSIYEHCTVKGPYGTIFAWAVNGRGKFSLYDNPPGSLQLLAHYGFCAYDDTIFLNTARWIRSNNNKYFHQGKSFEEAGSLHAGNPWPLSACNDLLSCNVGAIDFFSRAEMDNGFFCETIDPETGRLTTGAAFASGAGFLANALMNMRPVGNCYRQEQAVPPEGDDDNE